MKDNSIFIPRAASPESVGVSSREIFSFLEDIESSGSEFHSFMVIRHGKVAAECFRAPFSPERPHAMYSVSKTVTATAVAIAKEEGFLSFDEKVRDIFPDYTDGIIDEKLDNLTVRHLLTMTSGKEPSVFSDKSRINWIKDFFLAPWYNEPGKEFKYINENIYMLSLIVKRKTGLSVREFLKPRLFAPLGIDYPFWETDAYGNEAGGWGLYLKTEDLAKIMLTYQKGGLFGDKRIFSEEWVKFASSVQAETPDEFDPDAKAGYGGCLWRCSVPGTYRADGMFSQFGIVFEELDAVLVVTSAIAEEQKARDIIWKHFPAAFIDENTQEDTSCPLLQEKLKNFPLESSAENKASSKESIISGKEIHFRKKILLNLIGFPMSMLPLAVTYMTTDKAGNIDRMVLDFKEKECLLTWSEGDERNTIPLGKDGHYRYGTMRLGQIDYKVCSTLRFTDENTIYMEIRPVETIAKRKLTLRFTDRGKVRMKPSSDPGIYDIAMTLAAGFEAMVGNKKITDRIIPLFRFAPNLLEPTLKGSFNAKKP